MPARRRTRAKSKAKTVRKGEILDFEITLSILINSLNELVTSIRLVEAIIAQKSIKPI